MYTVQSYRILYTRISGMIGVLNSLDKRTDAQNDALSSLREKAEEYQRKMSILGWRQDSFLKRLN